MIWEEHQPGNPPLSRSSHGVSVVKDTLYLFGGEHEARTPIGNEVYTFDLKDEKMEWKMIPTTGDIPSPRFGHAQCSIGDCLYVFGGRMGTAIDEKLLNDLYEFDTRTKLWSCVQSTGEPPSPRSYHSMVSHVLRALCGCYNGARACVFVCGAQRLGRLCPHDDDLGCSFGA